MATRIFEGLGAATLVPRRANVTPEELGKLSPEEGFVLSRVDGRTSLEEICLLVPFPEAVSQAILRKLWEAGAIDVPGVARTLRRRSSAEQAGPPKPSPVLPEAPKESAAPDGTLSDEQKKRIDVMYLSLEHKNAFELLEVERGADDRAIKRAYFRLSKEYHPDRYFGRQTGDHAMKLSKIFQALKSAFELLSHPERRRAYEDSL
jgi:hypothetical protein